MSMRVLGILGFGLGIFHCLYLTSTVMALAFLHSLSGLLWDFGLWRGEEKSLQEDRRELR